MNPWNKKIPVELFRELRDYLQPREYFKFTSCSKVLFEDIKYETIIISGPASVLFDDSLELPSSLRKKLKDPAEQLKTVISTLNALHDFNYSAFSVSIEVFPLFRFLLDSQIVNCFTHVKELTLRGMQIQDFTGFQKMMKLEISSVQEFPDISCLHFLQELTIFCCWKFSSAVGLEKLQKLKIVGCPLLKDLSPLADVSDLHFENCFGITDVSSLIHNRALTILNCPNISSAVVPSLQLVQLETDIVTSKSVVLRNVILHNSFDEAFPSDMTLTRLTLINSQVYSTLTFSNLYEISLVECNNLTCTCGLRNVPLVNISRCPFLKDISDLGNNKTVKIDSCRKITSFRSLECVFRVELTHCCVTSSTMKLSNNYHLSLFSCHALNLPTLSTVQMLELVCCHSLTDLLGCENIPTIKIIYCHGLQSMRGVQNNKKLILSEIHYQMLLTEFPEYAKQYLFYFNEVRPFTITSYIQYILIKK
jgi:hypothetical protein